MPRGRLEVHGYLQGIIARCGGARAPFYSRPRRYFRILPTVDSEGNGIESSLLRQVSPVEWDNVVLYGQYVFDQRHIRSSRGHP